MASLTRTFSPIYPVCAINAFLSLTYRRLESGFSFPFYFGNGSLSFASPDNVICTLRRCQYIYILQQKSIILGQIAEGDHASGLVHIWNENFFPVRLLYFHKTSDVVDIEMDSMLMVNDSSLYTMSQRFNLVSKNNLCFAFNYLLKAEYDINIPYGPDQNERVDFISLIVQPGYGYVFKVSTYFK